MDEKQLISKIKELREIKPSQNWVVSTKVRVLGEDKKTDLVSVLEFFPRLILRYNQLAFACLVFFVFVIGAFGFAQGALPGDPIYVLKRITEKTQLAFVSEQDLPRAQLGLANKRLEELNKIAQTNQVGKLAPAIQEFQANISKAAQDLSKAKNPNVKDIVAQTKKLEDNKKKIESLGVVVGDTKEFDNALAQLVGRELKDFGARTLTDEQKRILISAAEDYWAGNYSGALEKLLSM